MPTHNLIAGRGFCLTGRLENLTRQQAERLIADRGGRVHSGVTRRTHILIAGDKPGAKLAKAARLGIPVWNEFEFMQAAGAAAPLPAP